MRYSTRMRLEVDSIELDKAEGGVRAVNRAIDVLLAFRPDDSGLSVAELLKRVDLSRATLYRLLDTLALRGLVTSEGEPQRFRLGPAVAQLAHAWSASMSYDTVAQPMMRRLWEITQETVSLHLQEGFFRVSVAELPSPQPLSFRRGVGYREKLARGASGRSILAFMNVQLEDLVAYGAENAVDAVRYMEQISEVRAKGYATSRDELIEGAVAIAAPFFEGSGRVVGSLGLFGPSVRLTENVVSRYSKALKNEAAQISSALGYHRKVPMS